MTTWLTKQAFDRLQEELAHLQGEAMAKIVSRIEAARAEGDLKENGGYHAAREEQAKLAGRIAQLKALLKTAQVGEAPVDASVVASGTVVTANVAGNEMKFLLGSREAAADLDVDVYSEASPLGKAILGAKPGEERSYTTPTGKEVAVKVLAVAPFGT
ncbi:MAG: transcription elongation factor GreA [Micrococcales bacterium]|nr:transcription elongation factor GreA [Micrococcales bacterium]